MTVDPMIAALTGGVLAVAIGGAAAGLGLDRDRAFYPTIVIVIASYYALFAIMAATLVTLAQEAGPIALFTALAVLGFRFSAWFIVAALLLHGVFDAVHGAIIPNPGVPLWWPGFCLAYDAVAAVLLAVVLLLRRRTEMRSARTPEATA